MMTLNKQTGKSKQNYFRYMLSLILKLFRKQNANSTKYVRVFAMDRESKLDKDIQLARAKRVQCVHAYLNTASNKAKDEFADAFTYLVHAVNFHKTISEQQ